MANIEDNQHAFCIRPPNLKALLISVVVVTGLSISNDAEAFRVPMDAERAPAFTAQKSMTDKPMHQALGHRIAKAALERTESPVTYDPAYRKLAYPNGDVASDRGVCSDVIIRVLRGVGLDLQKSVHEDMRANFSAYPRLWSAARPDPNIDHRRVPNLETFFTRAGARRPQSTNPKDFRAGDIVAWNLRGKAGVLPHIGIVTDKKGASGWPMIVHNIGRGPQHEDVLLLWPITGHYRLSDDLITAIAEYGAV
ncbi:MAG: DUF1287 domain-containing protein [Pseudomonadota bacterium]